MFESALLESSSVKLHQRSIWTKGLSFTLEAFVLGLAVLMPLLYTEALPRQVLETVELPSPPPSAPAPRKPAVASHPVIHSELNADRIMLPTMIPRRIQEIHDQAEVSSATDRDIGVVGSVPNPVGDRTIASLIRALPPAVPKSVTPQTLRVSSGVAQGLLIHEVRPQYPALARSAHIQGAVILQAIIRKDGTIQQLRLLSGHPLLVQAAVEAIRQWRYRPYLLNNEPVEVDTTIQVNFTLNGGS